MDNNHSLIQWYIPKIGIIESDYLKKINVKIDITILVTLNITCVITDSFESVRKYSKMCL